MTFARRKFKPSYRVTLLKRLKRRALYLKDRFETASKAGNDLSWDKSEYSALCWAILTLEAAILLGTIDELETTVKGLDLEASEESNSTEY